MYQAAKGEDVWLSGGMKLPIAAFASVTDSATLKRLPEDGRGRVKAYRLTPGQASKLGPEWPVTWFNGRRLKVLNELFADGKRLPLARWPNEGWTTIAKIIEAGSRLSKGDKSWNPGVFEYSGDRPTRWNVEAGVWLHGYYCFDWYAEAIKVRAIDLEKRQITFDAPALYSLRQGNPSPRCRLRQTGNGLGARLSPGRRPAHASSPKTGRYRQRAHQKFPSIHFPHVKFLTRPPATTKKGY